MALLESQSNATNSLRASHAICEGSFNSMKVDYQGMSQLIKVVNMVGERLGNKMKRRYLLTMYDSRTKLSKEVAEQVKEHFKEDVFKAVIPRNVKLAEAPSYGIPIYLYDPHSSGAVAYEQLASEVIGDE